MQRSSRRVRLGVVFAALVALFVALVPTRGVAAEEDHSSRYLAIGDSVAFGYSPLLNHANAANFIGYPNVAARQLEDRLTNAACPGETTSGFISLSGVDNGCRTYRFAFKFPLHTTYTGTQLAFTINFLKHHRDTQLVSIDIGANDLFVLQNQCALTKDPAGCITAGLPGTLGTIGANLDTIFSSIRNVAHYHHQLVALSYYSLNYADAAGTGITVLLNQVISAEVTKWGGVVADGFGAFMKASTGAGGDSCAAGLLIRLSATTCDVHPTPKGRNLLAGAIVEAAEDGD
ncbi:MAG TPA: GDSL-type esterase/lipase family protein [Candidatus Dormibacteraeota bacterium]